MSRTPRFIYAQAKQKSRRLKDNQQGDKYLSDLLRDESFDMQPKINEYISSARSENDSEKKSEMEDKAGHLTNVQVEIAKMSITCTVRSENFKKDIKAIQPVVDDCEKTYITYLKNLKKNVNDSKWTGKNGFFSPSFPKGIDELRKALQYLDYSLNRPRALKQIGDDISSILQKESQDQSRCSNCWPDRRSHSLIQFYKDNWRELQKLLLEEDRDPTLSEEPHLSSTPDLSTDETEKEKLIQQPCQSDSATPQP